EVSQHPVPPPRDVDGGYEPPCLIEISDRREAITEFQADLSSPPEIFGEERCGAGFLGNEDRLGKEGERRIRLLLCEGHLVRGPQQRVEALGLGDLLPEAKGSFETSPACCGLTELAKAVSDPVVYRGDVGPFAQPLENL